MTQNDENYEPQHAAEVPQVELVSASEPVQPWISSRHYDALKWVAQVLLPALATFYVTLAGLLELPAALAVSGTIMAVDTLLGVLLGLSKKQYENSGAAFDGAVSLVPDYEQGVTNLGVSIQPKALQSGQSELRLKVHR